MINWSIVAINRNQSESLSWGSLLDIVPHSGSNTIPAPAFSSVRPGLLETLPGSTGVKSTCSEVVVDRFDCVLI